MILSSGYRVILLLAGYALLLVVAYLLVLPSTAYAARPALVGAALLFDLTVWPLAGCYWLLARPQRWSWGRLGLVGIALLRLALWCFPNVPRPDAVSWPFLLAGVEGTFLLIALLRFYIIGQQFRQRRRTQTVDVSLQGALSVVFGDKIARFVVSEGEVIYYALLGWRQQAAVPAGAVPITSYRESGQRALLWGLFGISCIELIVVHLIVARWAPSAAI